MFSQIFAQLVEQSKVFAGEPGKFTPDILSGSLVEFNQLALSQAQKAGQKQLELVNKYTEYSLSQMARMGEVQSSEAFAATAKESIRETEKLSKNLMKDTYDWLGLGQQFSDEWIRWCENTLTQVNSANDSNHREAQ